MGDLACEGAWTRRDGPLPLNIRVGFLLLSFVDGLGLALVIRSSPFRLVLKTLAIRAPLRSLKPCSRLLLTSAALLILDLELFDRSQHTFDTSHCRWFGRMDLVLVVQLEGGDGG